MVEFFRKSKVTKDVPISEIFSDKYGGQETTATIRGGRFSEKYAIEFQVPDNPTYGAGKLLRLDLGLYTTELNLADNSTAIPKVVAYKVNDVSQSGAGREITEGAGNKKSDDILIYTSQLADFPSVEELFNGKTTSGPDEITYEPIQRTLFRKEKPYTSPKMMKLYGQRFEPKRSSTTGNADISQSESEIATNYGVKPSELGLNFFIHGMEQNINYSHTIGSPADGNWGDEGMTYTNIQDTVTPSSVVIPLFADNETKTKGGNAALFKADPQENKTGDTLYLFDNTAAVYFGNRDVIDNETYGNEVTSANSIFEYVRGSDEFIGENKKAEGESELFGVGAVRFSNKLQRTGGQSCQMYTFWKQQDDDPVSYPSKDSGGPKNRQECLIAKKNIPLPTKLPARPNWDNQDENHFASTIEIDIYIESLEKAYVHKTAQGRTHLQGSTNNIGVDDKNMITARRAIAICFSEDAPSTGQSFYDFVKDHACNKSSTRSYAYYDFGTAGGYTGQEGSTSGAMWSIRPTAKAIMADGQGGTSSTAKNFAGVLLVMTPEGPAIIPSSPTGTGNNSSGWLIDDNTKDIQVFQDSVYSGDAKLEDVVGKWIRLVFKTTPDGWTCYGPGRQSNNTLVSHIPRGLYNGQQHTYDATGGYTHGPTTSSHSILQVVDLGSSEIIKDGSVYGNRTTDHYMLDNNYVSEPNKNITNGAEFGANSLQHWPKNLSIWTMNYKNDKNVSLGKDEYMDGPTADTSSSVFIDAVRFNNFNFQTKNCSSKKYNPNASSVNIGTSSIWAGPDFPKIDNPILEGMEGDFKTNAPVVLSFGFKNSSDINTYTNSQHTSDGDEFHNFTSNASGNWFLFNGYSTSNLGANEEIPDCNIRFGYSGGANGEIEGGATTGTGNGGSNQVLKQLSAPGDGSNMRDFFIMKVDEDDLENTDSYHTGMYITIRAGTGKDQTRKIVASEFKDSDEQYVAVQPQFYNSGGTDSYVAITGHAFGNQFRNEGIGTHRAPGQGRHAEVGYGAEEWQKAMFTSRAHSINVTTPSPTHLIGTDGSSNNTADSSAKWDYPGWRYNDVGWATVGTPAVIDSTVNLHMAYRGYGTAQAGGSSSITLQSDMDATPDSYNGMMIILEGGTGAGQIREITDYSNSLVATVNKAWSTVPDETTQYRLRAAPYCGGHSRGPQHDDCHHGVSSGTHNNWVRKYQNSVTVQDDDGNPFSEHTDLQGGSDNTARFECKWFDTGLSEKGGAQITATNTITFEAHKYANDTNNQCLRPTTSNSYSPIRRYDDLCIGSIGQTGQQELSVATLPSSYDIIGTATSFPITSGTTLPAAIHSTIDRPVYNKLASSVNNFNRKGFVHFQINNDDYATRVYKRENLATSARVTEINNPENGQITFTVDKAQILASDDDEEYIVYLYGQMATFNDVDTVATVSDKGGSYEANPYCATGLKIIKRDLANNTVTLLWDGKANNGDFICSYDNLPALMISPYRYWCYVVLDCTDVSGMKALNSRSYRSVCWMESNANNMAGYLATGEALGNSYDHAMVAGTTAARQNFGSTWNEFKYNDSTVSGVAGAYINDWNLTRMEKGSSLDCLTDYGYGTFSPEDNTGGYCGKRVFYKNPNESQTENIMELPFIVQKGGIEPTKDVTLLLAFEDESLPHTLTLKASNPADDTYDPTIYSVYWDDRPAHPKLSVAPDEKDAFIPNFKWEAGDEDLWYGLLHIDNTNVPSQYHNMIGHLPLNEDTATTYGGVYFENGAGTKTAATAGTFTNTREGLAGYTKEFNGTTNYLQFADGTNFATKPSSEMTIVIHAIPDAAQADKGYLLSKHTNTSRVTDYEVYIDTDEKINAKITPDNGSTLELKSNTILPRDGQTPVSVIVTFDSNLKGGNMKLFIDGKLEDQTGLMDATGTSSNLKSHATNGTGEPVNQGTGNFYIGCNANGTTEEDFYDGKIEEVVIYNKCLYPVNPRDGQFKLTKPLREVENGSPISYQGRLFIKDYHNIRGNRTLDIASSSPVSFAKAGFRLS